MPGLCRAVTPHMSWGGCLREALFIFPRNAEGGLLHTWSGLWRPNRIHRVRVVRRLSRSSGDRRIIMEACGLISALHCRAFLFCMTMFPISLGPDLVVVVHCGSVAGDGPSRRVLRLGRGDRRVNSGQPFEPRWIHYFILFEIEPFHIVYWYHLLPLVAIL